MILKALSADRDDRTGTRTVDKVTDNIRGPGAGGRMGERADYAQGVGLGNVGSQRNAQLSR